MTQSHIPFINKADAIDRVASPKENRLLLNLLTIDTLYSIPDNIALWQEYTKQGNQFMKLGELAQPPDRNTIDVASTLAIACCQAQAETVQTALPNRARLVYTSAMNVATKLWQQAQARSSNPEIIHIYVISCDNLADCYEANNLSQRAEDLLMDAYDLARSTMQDPNFALDFQLEAYQSFQMVFRHLVDFYNRQQNSDAMTAIALQAGQQARQFLSSSNECQR